MDKLAAWRAFWECTINGRSLTELAAELGLSPGRSTGRRSIQTVAHKTIFGVRDGRQVITWVAGGTSDTGGDRRARKGE